MLMTPPSAMTYLILQTERLHTHLGWLFNQFSHLQCLHRNLSERIDVSEKIYQSKGRIFFCLLKAKTRTDIFCNRVQVLDANKKWTRTFFQWCARQKGTLPSIKVERGLVSDTSQSMELVEDYLPGSSKIKQMIHPRWPVSLAIWIITWAPNSGSFGETSEPG